MKTLTTVVTPVFLLAILIWGCTPAETEPEAASQEPNTLICEVFYRPDAGQSLQAASLITFTEGNNHNVHSFENMSFEARFQDDQFEGRALSIVVTNLETGDEIFRQLYQLDPQNPLENQFIGGHGFTGLNYVFHPVSSAEIQYFCSVNYD